MEDQARLTEALADRYQIEHEIGSGGMASVYLAQDLKHNRQVAVKVFNPELAQALGAERFLREIETAANLTHPHILPVHDSGEADGFLFFVMPYVKGESLRARLTKEKQLPVEDAIQITREIADALANSHEKGIIHRDVKPANILLESGHALLADFGLAKALSVAGDHGLTRAGFAVGTPAYISPEQAAGEGSVDGRSDLYSLGCVLYEMLAGQPPFVGPTVDSVARQHMTQEPTSVRVMRPAVPEPAEEILRQLLAKLPADRFQTAEELVRAFDAAISGEWKQAKQPSGFRLPRRMGTILSATAVLAVLVVGSFWVAGGGGPGSGTATDFLDRRAVAVLYFEDLSPDGGLQHVADGITEGLIRELSRVNELDVVSGNGVAQYRDGATSVVEIAELLETGTLIQGSLEPAGDMLRISVRLVEGTSGVDFDRRQFEVPSSELLLARDSVVSEVSWLLRERLGEEVRLRRRQAETSSVEAWALFHRGEAERTAADDLVLVGDAEGAFAAYARADSFFALAAGMDPQWVDPPTLQGWVAYRESRLASDLDAALEGIERGLPHAEEALALDPNAASALELRGTIRYWHHILGVNPDPQEAEALLLDAQVDLEAAVDMDPSRASAHSTLSHLYYRRGEITRAALAAQLAYEADAYLDQADAILWRLFTTSFDTERIAQARGWCEEGRRRFSGHYRFSECKLLELTSPTVTPDVDAAWRFRQETVDAAPEPQRPIEAHKTLMWVGEVLARAGLPDSARSVLAQARAGADVDPNQELVYLEARARTVLGDYDEAIDLLRQLLTGFSFENEAEAEGWANHWYWRDLRGRPEFERLVRFSR